MSLLRGLVALILIKCCFGRVVESSTGRRSLYSERFFSYEPKTKVVDHAAIDMDQKEIISELIKNTHEGFENAEAIYKHGKHSRPYAVIKLNEPFGREIEYDTIITGYNDNGEKISGTVMNDVAVNKNEIEFLYDTSDNLGDHVACQVGGSKSPRLDGCLAASGVVEIGFGKTPVNYTYDPMTENSNGRRMAKFTTEAKDKMFECKNCPYEDFMKFYDYYGSHSYADVWIMSAFSGYETPFRNGVSDFSMLSRRGRAGAVATGTVFMALWMYIIREMEDALDTCRDEKKTCYTDACNDDKVHAWDQAVAFYTGALGQSGDGFLLYALADGMCSRFGTCESENDDTAIVNRQIFEQFNEGQANLLHGKCDEAKKNKERIVQLMTVPLIQATLDHAIVMEHERSEKAVGEGASYAAAVLPIVHHCSPEDALIIQQSMRIKRAAVTDFASVKAAFERNYDCMGVTCEDVGGIIEYQSTQYIEGAGSCGSTKNGTPRKSGISGVSIIVILAGIIVLGISLVVMFKNKPGEKPVVNDNLYTHRRNEEDLVRAEDIVFQDVGDNHVYRDDDGNNDAQYNNTQYSDTQYNDTPYKEPERSERYRGRISDYNTRSDFGGEVYDSTTSEDFSTRRMEL